jgi:hypothetical protein
MNHVYKAALTYAIHAGLGNATMRRKLDTLLWPLLACAALVAPFFLDVLPKRQTSILGHSTSLCLQSQQYFIHGFPLSAFLTVTVCQSSLSHSQKTSKNPKMDLFTCTRATFPQPGTRRLSHKCMDTGMLQAFAENNPKLPSACQCVMRKCIDYTCKSKTKSWHNICRCAHASMHACTHANK